MYSRISNLLVIIITSFCLTLPALAKTEWQVRQKVQLDQAHNPNWIYCPYSILSMGRTGEAMRKVGLNPG